MFRNLLILMAIGLLFATACGEAQQETTVVEEVEEVIEEIEVVEVVLMNDPGNLTEYRDQNGEEFFFYVTGDSWGSVWGSDIYTDDSNLAAAAVHAGVLAEGEAGVVMVTILPGELEYTGSERNGLGSWDYGEWDGSYIVEALPENYEVIAISDPGNLTEYREPAGAVYEFLVTGDTMGSVWGTDIYSDDSNLATAAVHAGVLAEGETGIVTVTILPGQEAYAGSQRNGVTTWEYGSWDGSYSVE